MKKMVLVVVVLCLALATSGCLCCATGKKGIEGYWVSDAGKTSMLVEDGGVVTIEVPGVTYHGYIDYIGNATYSIHINTRNDRPWVKSWYVSMLDEDHVELYGIGIGDRVLTRHDELIRRV